MPRPALFACAALTGALLASAAAAQQMVTIDLTFSDKALAELQARGEGVVVSGYWMGDPAPGATLPATEIGTIFLLAEEITLQPAPARVSLGGSLSAAPLDQVTEPMLNVNVFSARWTDEDNLIDCGFLDDKVATLSAAPQSVHCKLIGE